MWYKYIIPRRVFFLNTRPYRWLNFLLFKYPRDLEWKLECIKGTTTGNFVADVSFVEIPYVVSGYPRSGDNQYGYYGPACSMSYRPSIKEAKEACETHYKRNHLGLQGILK